MQCDGRVQHWQGKWIHNNTDLHVLQYCLYTINIYVYSSSMCTWSASTYRVMELKQSVRYIIQSLCDCLVHVFMYSGIPKDNLLGLLRIERKSYHGNNRI